MHLPERAAPGPSHHGSPVAARGSWTWVVSNGADREDLLSDLLSDPASSRNVIHIGSERCRLPQVTSHLSSTPGALASIRSALRWRPDVLVCELSPGPHAAVVDLLHHAHEAAHTVLALTPTHEDLLAAVAGATTTLPHALHHPVRILELTAPRAPGDLEAPGGTLLLGDVLLHEGDDPLLLLRGEAPGHPGSAVFTTAHLSDLPDLVASTPALQGRVHLATCDEAPTVDVLEATAVLHRPESAAFRSLGAALAAALAL